MSKRINFLIFCLLIGTLGQYFLLRVSEAGERHAIIVTLCSVLTSICVAYWLRSYRDDERSKRLWIAFAAPTFAAVLIFLLAEKIDNVDASLILRDQGLTLIVATTVMAGGWLIGTATLIGLLFGFRFTK